jgi:hypothetical protein
MSRSTIVTPAVLALTLGVSVPQGWAQAGPDTAALSALRAPSAGPEGASRRSSDGRFEGSVTDDQDRPLRGAAVTAQGAELRFALTDGYGRFRFDALPAGSYVVRAHLPGFAASRRTVVDVHGETSSSYRFRLSPAPERVASDRPVLAAAIGTASGADVAHAAESAEAPETAAEGDHSHLPAAWRVRHLKRSALRDVAYDAGDLTGGGAVDPADAAATLSFLGDIPFSAQVQLLTISAFDSPEELFTGARVPHGVAYVSLSAPAGDDASWTVQGALTQGDVSSWVLGGNYVTTKGQHNTDFGMSYAAQRYDGGNPVALSAMAETSRTVGAIHAFDRWLLAPAVDVRIGGRYAHYGYIDSAGLFSPSVEWRWRVRPGDTIRAYAGQQMVAPGGEEFVPSMLAGLWMPPQRTFSPLGTTKFRASRTRHLELALERELSSYVIEARGFRQTVADQVVAIFGLQQPDSPRTDLGHYFTGAAGNVVVAGWGLALRRPVAPRLRGEVAYTMAHATWLTSADAALYAAFAQSAARAATERIHDLTTTIETDIPETATRLWAVYRLNSGYAEADGLDKTPGLGGRFDVQVNQRLPFVPLGDAEWELLVAVRSLFRTSLDGASLYDELLVVRPPKRIVGGLMIRF